MVLLSCKSERLVDFFGLSVQLPFTLTAYIFYLTGWIDHEEGRPTFQMYIFSVFFLVSCIFMSSNFLLTLLLRQAMCWTFIILNTAMWATQSSDSNYGTVIATVAVFLLMEGGNFCNMRSKALLFMQVRKMGMQERQLSNLLDSLPDKVLICTKAQEGKAPKSIYSNMQMNAFFGCDLVAQSYKMA